MSGAVKMSRRLYLTADGTRAVEEGDPEAATLLCAAGGEVSYATAARFGLLPGQSGEDTEPSSETTLDGESEEKARRQVPNKARSRPADKGA